MKQDQLEIAESLKLKTRMRYKALEYFDEGGTGLIYIAQIAGGEKHIIKVLRPDIATKKSSEAFRQESNQLLSLSSPNIIRGFEVGEIHFKKLSLPYLVMEYFEHEDLDKQRKELWLRDWDSVLGVIHQVLKGLAALHEKSICHLDIKERNILVDLATGTSKLLDLGSAKSTSEVRGKTTITGTFNYWPDTWRRKLASSKYQIRGTSIVLPRSEINLDVDMHMLGVTISNIIGSAPTHLKETNLFKRLQLFAERMNWDERTVTVEEERYLSAQDALNDWPKVSPERVLPSSLKAQNMIRLPVLSVTHFSDEVRALINVPWVLRMKNVLQLATAHLVYPGAKHDRYEHSLGVYENTLRYIQALFANKNSVWPSMFVDDEDCIYLAVAALLHDLGHYPFAHQIEDVEGAPSPDEISYALLAGTDCPATLQRKYAEILEDDGLREKFGDPRAIRTAIEQFGIDYTRFLSFAAYCYGFDEKTMGAKNPPAPRKWGLLASIISGPIDADKFDYVQRDSWHCGTKFGRDMDAERFFISLTPNIGKTIELAVTD